MIDADDHALDLARRCRDGYDGGDYEYDQGDVVAVAFDDLYNLARVALASISLIRRGYDGHRLGLARVSRSTTSAAAWASTTRRSRVVLLCRPDRWIQMPEHRGVRKRRLTDSEARWEAIVLIDATVRNAIAGGCLHQPDKWTDDDAIAIERHAMDRVDGLLSRHRKLA